MIPKPTKIISKKIRQSAKDEHCTLRLPGICHVDTNTTVFAHINSPFKGVGNKSPDIFGVYACHACHAELDAGRVSYRDQLRSMQETQMRLYQKRLFNIN